jgi:SOS response regulatory protein OraA/RecX
VGVELERERARVVARERRRRAAMVTAVRSLRTRDLSKTELHSRLARAGVAPTLREETVSRLADAGAVDDLRFARSRAGALAGRGAGDALIRHDLAGRGVDRERIETAVDELEPEVERARRIVTKLGRGPRTARRLARKGFSEHVIESACEETVAEDAPPAVR